MPRRIRISRLQNLSLTADDGIFSWAGNSVNFVKSTNRTITPLKGTFSWSGFSTNLTRHSFRIQASSASFSNTGSGVTFTYTPSSSLGWSTNIMPISLQQGGFFDFSTRITGNQGLIGAITPTLSATGTVTAPLPTGVTITNSPTWRLVASQNAVLGATANESFEIIQAATQLSIASFGAVTGTTVNNINAIHNCIAHAKLIGATVLIPAGTWAYSGNINLDSVTMTGVGDTSILYALNPALEAIMMTGTAPSVRSMFLSGVTPPSRSSDRHANRIVAEGCTGFTVDGVLIQSSSAVGIMSFGGSQGVISNNRISGTLADGIHMTNGSNNITVNNNTITNCADDGVATVSYVGDGVICSNITARNNTISNYTGGRGMSVVGGQDVLYEQNTISNLTTNAGRKAGILIAQESSFHTYGCTRVTVQFNTVTNCGDTVANGHTGIFVNDANELPNTTIRITRNDVIQTQTGQGALRVDNGQNVDIIFDQNRTTVVSGTTAVYNQCIPAATVNPYVSGPVGVTTSSGALADFNARADLAIAAGGWAQRFTSAADVNNWRFTNGPGWDPTPAVGSVGSFVRYVSTGGIIPGDGCMELEQLTNGNMSSYWSRTFDPTVAHLANVHPNPAQAVRGPGQQFCVQVRFKTNCGGGGGATGQGVSNGGNQGGRKLFSITREEASNVDPGQVAQDTGYRGIWQMYMEHGFAPYEEAVPGTSDFNLQPGGQFADPGGLGYCSYQQNNSNIRTDCWRLDYNFPEWHTYMIHVIPSNDGVSNGTMEVYAWTPGQTGYVLIERKLNFAMFYTPGLNPPGFGAVIAWIYETSRTAGPANQKQWYDQIIYHPGVSTIAVPTS